MEKIACLLFILSAAPLCAQTAPDTPARVVLYSGVAADLASTELAIANGYHEANPVLGQDRLRRVSVTVGGTVATDLLIHRLVAPRHPKMAMAFDYAVGLFHFGVMGWNLNFKRR